ncbi:hypothetical protein C5Y96_07220 [Blastopirellula marina]|uniref:Uncharacterized protein n=1 Tax=Blastopirellula marina TaxID=124 RepID=A0A2S8FXP6_9BACT|nr:MULTISPECIES: hypothetical protein [Pirellulaceae]PQO36945.1 hypothetical protein C5Y96_07220 [Blastopirellula marina]RCS53660.1 hypothetical protein DTL36_07230 [Bremerella cremea]
MIYGYDDEVPLNDYGLKRLKSLSIAASPDTLRALAGFLYEAAAEMESSDRLHSNWHRHPTADFAERIECEIAVLANET